MSDDGLYRRDLEDSLSADGFSSEPIAIRVDAIVVSSRTMLLGKIDDREE